MAWYQVINIQHDSYSADREAEALLRHLSAALREASSPGHVEVFYGRTPAGARVYYLSLSGEAWALTQAVLTRYEVTSLAAPPDLRGTEKIYRV